MKVIQTSANKMGLKLALDKVSITETEYAEQDIEKTINRINGLLNGRLPVPDEPQISDINAIPHDAPFPLTDIQYAYLIGRNSAMPLGGIATHYYFELELHDPDMQKLNVALNDVITLHPMLRAKLLDSARQHITPFSEHYQIEITDARNREEGSLYAFFAQKRHEITDNLRPLDNNLAIDIRATLLRNNTVRLHLYFELMFIDIHSIKIIMRDWWKCYQNTPLPEIIYEAHFPAYVEMEKKISHSVIGKRDQEYWLKKINTLPAAPELPLNQSPESIVKPVFKTISRQISSELLHKLQQTVTQYGITLETLFLGAYIEILRQWSRKQNFTLTLTQHARRHYFSHTSQEVGNFLQSCLLSIEDTSADTFASRLVKLQTELLMNRWHSSFNGIQVIREMTRQSNHGRALSFPVVFSNTLNSELHDIVEDDPWKNNAKIVYSKTQTPGIWLENQLLRINDKLVMNWNYVEGIFPSGMPMKMFDATLQLLDACINDPSIWQQSGSVVPLPNNEWQERMAANSTTDNTPPQLLQDFILNSAHHSPHKIAIIQGNKEVSYGVLVNSAYQIAEQLNSAINITPGDIIAVSIPQGAEMLAAILGILISGAAYVSIDPQLPLQRKLKLIHRCSAKAIVTLGDLAPYDGLLNITASINHSTPVTLPQKMAQQTVNDLAYVIFTSGSTGEPKGVMISHRSASNTILDINRRFNINSNDRVFSVAPPGFDLSVYDYFGILGAGGSILFATENAINDPKEWVAQMIKHRVTVWNSVPAPMKALMERAGKEMAHSALRLVLLSGDWIPLNLPDEIKAVNPHIEVISLGGATEGSIWSIVYPINKVDASWKSIPYGKPLANQQFHVLNEWFEACPQWVTGELFIAGQGIAKGYLGDDKKTQERFFNHPISGERLYRTGDLGRYINDGLIEILGREDNQVKINGYRIELGEIEACLLQHTQASHVVINAVPHPKTHQKQLAAYIVTKQKVRSTEQSRLENEFRELIQNNLPSYMLPTWFVLLDDIPLTTNGKIDRNALPIPWESNLADKGEDKPSNDIEKRLFTIWRNQLKYDDFSITDGFFDIGGDSLHAVGLLSAVREAFHINASREQDMIESLFMNASVRDFSRILSSVANPA